MQVLVFTQVREVICEPLLVEKKKKKVVNENINFGSASSRTTYLKVVSTRDDPDKVELREHRLTPGGEEESVWLEEKASWM